MPVTSEKRQSTDVNGTSKQPRVFRETSATFNWWAEMKPVPIRGFAAVSHFSKGEIDMRAFICALASGAAILSGVPAGAAEEVSEPWTFNTLLENDFFGSDRHYTSGLYLSATSGSSQQCDTCRSLADTLMLPEGAGPMSYRYGYFLGQSIFTPENLSLAPPDPLDRPYAGWLYLGARLYREAGNTLDRLELKIGVVGPASGADAVQRWWHALHWFGGVPPQGWHSQLKDEPGLVLTEQRIWRLSLIGGPIEAELLPEANVSVGNVFTYAAVGMTFRFGQNLHADWGPPRIEPALQGSDFVNYDELTPVAWYLFAGFEGRAVARNIFLDGNTFQHSASVSKKPLVGDLNAGIAFLWRGFSAHMSYTQRTREFKTQNGDDKIFSIGLSFSYVGHEHRAI